MFVLKGGKNTRQSAHKDTRFVMFFAFTFSSSLGAVLLFFLHALSITSAKKQNSPFHFCSPCVSLRASVCKGFADKTQQTFVCGRLPPLNSPPKPPAQAHLKRSGQMPPLNSPPNLPAALIIYAPCSIRKGFAGLLYRWTFLQLKTYITSW